MAGIVNREFTELAQNGLNYLTWASDVEIFLTPGELTKAIGPGTQAVTGAITSVQNAQALHFPRHHLCSTLKNKYMAERSALDLWNALKTAFRATEVHCSPAGGGGVDTSEVLGLPDGGRLQFGFAPDLHLSSNVWCHYHRHLED